MKRLLIVSPHFPPVNAPDMQRVRMSLAHYAQHGWSVRVLACRPDAESQVVEPELLEALPVSVPIVRVRALPPALTRLIGLGNLGWRALPALARAGDALIRDWRPDLVFFSTTQFPVLRLGPRWRRHGIPFAADLQDPLVTDFYDRPGAPPPPGGWKYRLAQKLATRLERRCLPQAAGLMSVSTAYLDDLQRRYPCLRGRPTLIQPFGVPVEDIAQARLRPLPPPSRPALVYAGTYAPADAGMRVLFRALASLAASGGRPPHVELYGTNYAAAGRSTPMATRRIEAAGVQAWVSEQPGRLAFGETQRRMAGADGLLIFGSSDPGYTPSKIFPVLAHHKPTLAIVPEGSAAAARLAPLAPHLELVTFAGTENDLRAVQQVEAFLIALVEGRAASSRFDPVRSGVDAASLVGAQAAFFDSCRAGHSPHVGT